MKQYKRSIIGICVMLLALFMCQSVQAATTYSSKASFTPVVVTKEITSRTTQIQVYCYPKTTLFIKNGTKTVFKKYYKKEGLKNVTIARQKGGSQLSFSLVYKRSSLEGNIVTKSVTALPKVSTLTYSGKVKKPIVQETITNKNRNITVYGYKGTTLWVRNEKGTTLNRLYFSKDQQIKIRIPRQKNGTIYFYMKKGNLRSAYVKRTVVDVIAPDKPEVTVRKSVLSMTVKGEVGTKVYVRNGINGKWTYRGVILTSDGLLLSRINLTQDSPYYYVRLRDASGNYSEYARKKDPNVSADSQS